MNKTEQSVVDNT